MNIKKFLVEATVGALMLGSIATTAFAAQSAAPGKNKLTCFADAPAICTTNKSGNTATLDTSGGGDAGVYLAAYNSSFYGVRVAQVPALSFTYTGTAGVDPRWSIPIDSNHDGYTEYFLFVSASTCNNGLGLADVINDTTCTLYDSRDALVSYPNWTAYTTANTNDYIALNDYYAFVIADSSQGVWTISNVTVGKPGR